MKKTSTKYPQGYVKASGYATGEDQQFKLMKKRQEAKKMSNEELVSQYSSYSCAHYRDEGYQEAILDILRDEILRRMR